MKRDPWRWVERIVTFSAIAVLLIDNVKLRTTTTVTLYQMKDNYEKIENYMERQNEINGKFVILYDYFITGSTGTGEETEAP